MGNVFRGGGGLKKLVDWRDQIDTIKYRTVKFGHFISEIVYT